jgi:Na+/glutamate symporter
MMKITPVTQINNNNNNNENNDNNQGNSADKPTQYSERTSQMLAAMRLEYVLGIVSISLALASLMLALRYIQR